MPSVVMPIATQIRVFSSALDFDNPQGDSDAWHLAPSHRSCPPPSDTNARAAASCPNETDPVHHDRRHCTCTRGRCRGVPHAHRVLRARSFPVVDRVNHGHRSLRSRRARKPKRPSTSTQPASAAKPTAWSTTFVARSICGAHATTPAQHPSSNRRRVCQRCDDRRRRSMNASECTITRIMTHGMVR